MIAFSPLQLLLLLTEIAVNIKVRSSVPETLQACYSSKLVFPVLTSCIAVIRTHFKASG